MRTLEDIPFVVAPEEAMERYLRTRIPSEWFSNGPVGYVRLSGDAAHLVSHGSERVYVVAPPATELESYWPSAPKPASLSLVGVRVLLVFSSSDDLLAEIHANDGAFVHAVLSVDGEEELGSTLHEWQTAGVPELCTTSDGTCVLVERRVNMRNPAFFGQAADWLSAQGYHLRQTTDGALEEQPKMTKPTKNVKKKIPKKKKTI